MQSPFLVSDASPDPDPLLTAESLPPFELLKDRDIETKDNKLSLERLQSSLTPYQVFYRHNLRTIPLVLSFTFSGSLFLITYKSMRIPSSSEQETNDNLAAGVYINIFYNLGVSLVNGMTYSISFLFNKLHGQYTVLKKLKAEPQALLPEEKIYSSAQNLPSIITESMTDLSRADSISETFPNRQEDIENELQSIKIKIESLIKNGLLLPSLAELVSIALLLTSESILLGLRLNPDAASKAKNFLQPIVLYIPCIKIRMIFEQIIVSTGKESTFKAMLIADIDFAIGAFLADALCFGRYGFPQLDFAGLAWGLVIDSFLTAVNYGILLKNLKALEDFSFFPFRKCNPMDAEQLDDLADIALPTEAIIAAETFSDTLINVIIAALPENQVAAYGISSFLFFLMIMFATAFGLITGQEVTQAIAKQEYGNASQFARYGLLSSTFWVLLGNIILCADPSLIISIVEGDLHPEVKTTAAIVLPITAVNLLAKNTSFHALQVYRARQEHIKPTKWFLGSLGLGVILAYFTGISFETGVIGIAVTDCIINTITALGLCYKLPTSPESFAAIGRQASAVISSGSKWFSCFSKLATRWCAEEKKEEPKFKDTPKNTYSY